MLKHVDVLENVFLRWQPREPRQSDIYFVAEFFRRMGLWQERLRIQIGTPFIDLAPLLDADVPEGIPAELQALAWFSARSPSYLTNVGAWHLKWLNLPPSILASLSLPAPYEPLIQLWAAGGHFTTEHGFLNVGGGSIVMRHWRSVTNAAPFQLPTD